MAEEQVEATMTEVREQEPQAQAATEQAPQAQAQAEPVDATDWKAEARKWEARAKENGKKAKLYDEAQEAAKSDLQRATERAEQAEAELAAIRAQQAREVEVKAAAARYGVDEATLARMSGDVDENAAFLQSRKPKQPAYPQVTDNGEVPVKGITKEDIEKVRDPEERVRLRAQHMDLYR